MLLARCEYCHGLGKLDCPQCALAKDGAEANRARNNPGWTAVATARKSQGSERGRGLHEDDHCPYCAGTGEITCPGCCGTGYVDMPAWA